MCLEVKKYNDDILKVYVTVNLTRSTSTKGLTFLLEKKVKKCLFSYLSIQTLQVSIIDLEHLILLDIVEKNIMDYKHIFIY